MLDLLPGMLPNIIGIIENWSRWSEIVAVKLPDIMSDLGDFNHLANIEVENQTQYEQTKSLFKEGQWPPAKPYT